MTDRVTPRSAPTGEPPGATWEDVFETLLTIGADATVPFRHYSRGANTMHAWNAIRCAIAVCNAGGSAWVETY